MNERTGDGATAKAAIKLNSHPKPGLFVSVTGNRAGYTLLRDAFGRLAAAPPHAFATGSEDAEKIATDLNEHLVPTGRLSFQECALEESLADEFSQRTARSE